MIKDGFQELEQGIEQGEHQENLKIILSLYSKGSSVRFISENYGYQEQRIGRY